MKNYYRAVLVVVSALATYWMLKGEDVLRAAPSAPAAAVVAEHSIFAGRPWLLVAEAGACNARSDASPSLMGASNGQQEIDPDRAVEDQTEAVAAEAIAASTPDSSPSSPTAQGLGGSCGTQHLTAANPAGTSAPRESVAPSPPVEEPPTPAPSVEMDAPKSVPDSPKENVAVAAAPPRIPKKAKTHRVQPPKEPLTAWWPARKAGVLNVLFVGEAAFGSAISLLTDGRFETAESANQHIEVRSAAGTRVDGRWQVSKNTQMLLLVVEPGVYRVTIPPELVDAQGRQVGTASGGLVYVR